jgi:hypothetical protein
MKFFNKRNVIVTAIAALGGVLLFWRRKGGAGEHPTAA